MKTRLSIGQIVHDRTRPQGKGPAIVIDIKAAGRLRICYWRGRQQHWSLPHAVDKAQVQPIVDWTLLPLTEAKRFAAAAFERGYLVRMMAAAEGTIGDAALAAGVDRSNFRRLLQRHALVKTPHRPKRAPKATVRHKAVKAAKTTRRTKRSRG
jgi:DNA-binding protein Fis